MNLEEVKQKAYEQLGYNIPTRQLVDILDKPTHEEFFRAIQDKIDINRDHTARIRQNAAYADHGAYGQDMERARKVDEKTNRLQAFVTTYKEQSHD